MKEIKYLYLVLTACGNYLKVITIPRMCWYFSKRVAAKSPKCYTVIVDDLLWMRKYHVYINKIPAFYWHLNRYLCQAKSASTLN